MIAWRYHALDPEGRERIGRLEAPDERGAAETLRGESLFVLSLAGEEPAGAPAVPARPRRQRLALVPVTSKDRMLFFRQLALMLRSGLTLLSALSTSARGAAKPRFGAALLRVRERIQAGTSFSQALEEARYFQPLEIRLIESAEVSGEMDTVLQRLALFIERRADLRTKLLTGLTYPAIVVAVSIAVVAFLAVKVIPKFAAFFQRRSLALPWATRALLDVSAWVEANVPWLVLGALAAGVVLALARRTPRGRVGTDRALLSFPVVGPLLVSAAMTHFARTLAMLLASGVTLLASLRLTARTISNRFLAGLLEGAGASVLAGNELAASLSHPAVPPLVGQIVTVGERTGSLAEVLEEIAAYYERDLEARVKRLMALVEPGMILVVGGTVGFVYYAFFQAILQLSAR